MRTSHARLRAIQLDAKRLAELSAQAKQLGMTPASYARELIERGLAMEQEARTKSFDEILAPLRATKAEPADDALDMLVDQARSRHHRATKRKGR